MEVRAPYLNADGSINCEVNHPLFGWIPFTAREDDVEAHGREIFALAAAMNPPPAPPGPAPDPKLVGVEFQGVMCSATAEDQHGLAAVLLAIQLQGQDFQPTRFYFANGNTLIITLSNWQAFAATWLPFRQSFFAVT